MIHKVVYMVKSISSFSLWWYFMHICFFSIWGQHGAGLQMIGLESAKNFSLDHCCHCIQHNSFHHSNLLYPIYEWNTVGPAINHECIHHYPICYRCVCNLFILIVHFSSIPGECVRSAVGSNNFQLPGIPKFLEEPKAHYYIVKNKPVTITCKASPTTVILKFKCSGVMVSDKHVVKTISGDADDQSMQARHEVTRDEVEEYFGDGGYWCECHATSLLSDPLQLGKVKSSRGYVETSCELVWACVE